MFFYTSALAADQWMWCVFVGIGSLLWGQVRLVSSSTSTLRYVPEQNVWWWGAEILDVPPSVGRGNPVFLLYPFTSPLPYLLLCLLVSFTFYLFPYLLVSSIIYQINPTPFPCRCRSRLVNLALVLCVLYVFLIKDACLFLSYLI